MNLDILMRWTLKAAGVSAIVLFAYKKITLVTVIVMLVLVAFFLLMEDDPESPA